jgi:hypothetical protein
MKFSNEFLYWEFNNKIQQHNTSTNSSIWNLQNSTTTIQQSFNWELNNKNTIATNKNTIATNKNTIATNKNIIATYFRSLDFTTYFPGRG